MSEKPIIPVEAMNQDEMFHYLITNGNDAFLKVKKMQDAHVRLVNRTAELVKDYVSNGEREIPLSKVIMILKQIRSNRTE